MLPDLPARADRKICFFWLPSNLAQTSRLFSPLFLKSSAASAFTISGAALVPCIWRMAGATSISNPSMAAEGFPDKANCGVSVPGRSVFIKLDVFKPDFIRLDVIKPNALDFPGLTSS